MATLALLILGLAGLTLPAEAAKYRTTEHSAPRTAEKVPPKIFHVRSLVDDEGETLDYHSGDLTDLRCAELCAAKDECKSFTFKLGINQDDASCHLKRKCVDHKTPEKLLPVDIFSTFYKTYVNGTWTERALVADEGISISDHQGMDIAMCQQECNSNAKCKSISFGGGWCHLKDKCVTEGDTTSFTEFAGFRKTYYLSCKSESDTWRERTLVANEGDLLADFSLPLEDCQIKCDGDPVCNSISYQRNSGTCRLHNKVVTVADDASNAQHTAYRTYYDPC